jgi:hypothetical protein
MIYRGKFTLSLTEGRGAISSPLFERLVAQKVLMLKKI